MDTEQPQTYYALDNLRKLHSTLGKAIHQMVVLRAKVEKYREKRTDLAGTAYTQLVYTRDSLLDDLADLQRTLQELEEFSLSKMAGKLQVGFGGFNLMSTNYKPVYDLCTQFLAKLPIQLDTANAAVSGRLMNRVKMGYYPTDPTNIDLILHGIAFPEDVTVNLLDPCCGCGTALRQMAQGHHCNTYGVELDESRAQQAQLQLHRVGIGSYFHCRVSHEAFHGLFLNPPYLSVMEEGGSRSRHEKRFLVDSLKTLLYGGLLIYVIPYYRLTADICRILSDNFANLTVWKFTEDEFQKFKQIAVVGVRKPRTEDSQSAKELERLGYSLEDIPSLTTLPEKLYTLPAVAKKVAMFKGAKFNEAELSLQLRQSDSFQRLLSKSQLDSAQKHPLLPLSIGQIGLIGGSGMINGLVDCDTPHIIKGRIVKVKSTEENSQFTASGIHMGAEIKEVISNKMIFNVLTPEGFKSLA